MKNSNLINGFTDYKALSAFFQNVAKKMKDDGECNLSGNTLLERFCEQDGVSNRRTIKDMFNEVNLKKTLENINSYSDLIQLLKENNNDFKLINTYFENKSEYDFGLLDAPRYYNKPQEYFYISTDIGDIIFGEVEKAKYFSRNIKTEYKYFVAIDNSKIKSDRFEIKTLRTNDFHLAISRLRKLVNRYRNTNYLDNINDSTFVQIIRSDDKILAIMKERWETNGGNGFTDAEIIPILKTVMPFKRKISNEMFQEIKTYLNCHLYFRVSGYKDFETFEKRSSDNGLIYTFEFEAMELINKELLDKYEYIWIRSFDNKITSFITKENYQEILEKSKNNPFTSS